MFQFSVDPPITPPAPHAARPVGCRRAGDESMIETLMTPLTMIALDELGDGVPEVPLTDWNDAVETFFLDRPDESLGVGVRVWRALGDQLCLPETS